MSDFPDAAGLRSLLPTEPGPWAWSRLKVYLAVLAVVVVGFFLVADWYAAPTRPAPIDWLHAVLSLVLTLGAAFSWRMARRELDKQHRQSSK